MEALLRDLPVETDSEHPVHAASAAAALAKADAGNAAAVGNCASQMVHSGCLAQAWPVCENAEGSRGDQGPLSLPPETALAAPPSPAEAELLLEREVGAILLPLAMSPPVASEIGKRSFAGAVLAAASPAAEAPAKQQLDCSIDEVVSAYNDPQQALEQLWW